jgi:hypothetical protein
LSGGYPIYETFSGKKNRGGGYHKIKLNLKVFGGSFFKLEFQSFVNFDKIDKC